MAIDPPNVVALGDGSRRHHSATRSRFMSAHYAVVFVECGGAPPPFSIG